jgi:hypothetical protein
MRKSILAVATLLAAACRGSSGDYVDPARLPTVTLGDTVKVVPNANFPAEVTTSHSNNNLDVIDFDGRTYLVFRTAPTHFASDKVLIYVVSSQDEVHWDFEAKFFKATDEREPRFFAWKGKLFLFFSTLGKDMNAFEPGQMYRSERVAQGEWTAPVQTFEPDFIPWRIKIFDGKPIMIGYVGGAAIYDFTGQPLKIYLLTTENGVDWVPLNPKRPVVEVGGGSETDIEFDAEGNLFALTRNEAGDDSGFGSKICWAPKADITQWRCKHDPRKYDSPLLLKHAGEIYLIGRRNVTETGNYDLGRDGDPYDAKLAYYQLEYWNAPKRCSLWHYERSAKRIDFVLDFPSKGDTCFPSILWRGPNTFTLYNYSSDIDGEDVSWHQGQLGDTFIYTTQVTFGK